MKCKKCKKVIDDDSLYCKWCGAAQKKDAKKKMYQRPDGLYEKIVTINGKRIPFRGKTEKEVQRKMIEYQEQEERGPLFCEVAEEWENVHFPTLAYSTAHGYTPAKRRAMEYFGDTPIRQIGIKDVKSYIASLPKTWAQKTFRNHLLVLNLILEYAASNAVIEHNPTEHVQLPKGLKKTYRRAPTQDEIEIIKNSLDKTFGLFAYFLLFTGCRRGEALALQYKDIDYQSKLIHITKSLYHMGNVPKIKQPKTERGNRDIILLDILERVLPSGKPDEFLFGDGINPLTASRAEDLWQAYQKETGMLTITPHIVRHGYASILHEAGIDPKDAQEMLGHANISTTLDIYTHITERKKSETAQKLNEFTKSTQ